MILGSRAAVTLPKEVLTCAPDWSHCAVVPTVLNCVWLKTLYASQRSWVISFSRIVKFLNRARSVLLIPGPRANVNGVLPRARTCITPARLVTCWASAGGEKTDALNHWSTFRAPDDSTGLPDITARQASPPPVMSVPKLLVVVAAHGAFGMEQPVLRLVDSESGAPL